MTSFHEYYAKNKGPRLVLKTRVGTAELKDEGTNLLDFIDALHTVFPGRKRSFHEDGSVAGFLFLLAAFGGWYLGHCLVPANAPISTDFAVIVPLVIASTVSVYLWIDSLGRR